jgi:hypothetical protein
MRYFIRFLLIFLAILFVFRLVGRMLGRTQNKSVGRLNDAPKPPDPPPLSNDIHDATFTDIPK